MTTHPVPRLPGQLITDTTELLMTLDRTVASLRDFTNRLHAATEASRREDNRD